MSHLFFDPIYFEFLQKHYPHLELSRFKSGLPFFTCSTDLSEAFRPGFIKSLYRFSSFIFAPLNFPKILFLGLPFEPYDQSIALNYLPSKDELLKKARDINADLIALTNVSPCSQKILREQKLNFFSISSFANAKIVHDSKTFENFLQTLKKKYRANILRDRKIFLKRKHKIIFNKNIDQELGRNFYNTYLQTLYRANIKWIPSSLSYFLHFNSLHNSCTLTAFTHTNQFLGFIQLLHDGPTMHFCRIGTSDLGYRKDSVFFELIYGGVEQAIENGCKISSLAPTIYRTKKRMGATFDALKNFILPVSPMWRFLLERNASRIHKSLSYLDSFQQLEDAF